jgi:PleD family two-component response regulator
LPQIQPFTQAPFEQAPLERDNKLLAELSQTNNDLVTTQRELAKKNAILTRTNESLEEAHIALEVKQAALEEANARLDILATTDGLTGVKNRRAFGERLAEEVARSTRYNVPLSLLLLDVDKFKQFNDTFAIRRAMKF